MIMPKIKHQILTSNTRRRQRALNDGEYGFLLDQPSTPSFYFETLERDGQLSKHNATIRHLEPDETFAALGQGDDSFRSILFFPYDWISRHYSDCSFLTGKHQLSSDQECILFGSQEFISNKVRKELLERALRDAWLTLMQGGPALNSVLDRVINETCYIKCVQRFSGLELSSDYLSAH